MNKKIGYDLINGAFGKFPHDVYLTYDELTDELIVRLIDPNRVAYMYELKNNDRFALLVEADSDEIIGFQLFNFEEDHLQKSNWSNMKKVWNMAKEIYRTIGFTKFRYDPEKTAEDKDKNPILYSTNEFHKELEKAIA